MPPTPHALPGAAKSGANPVIDVGVVEGVSPAPIPGPYWSLTQNTVE